MSLPAWIGLLLLVGCEPDVSNQLALDNDGDGYTEFDGDCNDGNPEVHPNAEDEPYIGGDTDCGGEDDYDADGDGYVLDEYLGLTTEGVEDSGGLPGGDCDDEAEGTYPGADDAWYDGVDADCGGEDDYDADGDGYVPDEYEGLTTEGVEDSGGLPAGDCDDANDAVRDGMKDDWYDGVDTDCGGEDDYDADGDGYVLDEHVGLGTSGVDGSGELPGGDCNDNSGLLNQDDDDGDGVTTCDGDCNDGNAYIYPGAAYNDSTTQCMKDMDGDGYGEAYPTEDVAGGTDCDDEDASATPEDNDEDGQTSCAGDCNDADASIYAGATDSWYDGVDTDCGEDDDYDADGDGYVLDFYVGETTEGLEGSGELEGGDCDDHDATVEPADLDGDGQSTCESDCDDTDAATYAGAASSDSTTACTTDSDGDGWGEENPAEGVTAGTDCDDDDDALEWDDLDGDGYSTCEED
ncbi:MAG: hypothetical protein QGG40_12470, partial [Myxococcota bacterium]|nr:hypothetical protein [Myxococcota bacterium]